MSVTPVQQDGTVAKDIAAYFLKITNQKVTSSLIARNIIQAKKILERGYKYDTIIAVIDHVLRGNPGVYSLGYINLCIDSVSRKVKTKEDEERTRRINRDIENAIVEQRDEVTENNGSTERNKQKRSNFGIQPRFGKESFSDLFKE